MFRYNKILELTKRYRGLVLFLFAVVLLGGQIATMSLLVEEDEDEKKKAFRFDIPGLMDSEFGTVDIEALEAMEKAAKEEQAQNEAEADTKKAEMKKADPEGEAANQIAANSEPEKDKVHPLKKQIADLSSSNPLNAKCFGTTEYVSHGNGSDAFKNIRGGVVQKLVEERDFSDELTSPESIVARMWLARARALNAEGGQTHLSALGNYLIAAQRTLKDAHQYYGEEGLNWAKTLLKTKADKRVFEQIKLRVPSKRFTRKLNQKMQLLTDHTDDFIPCTVRAERQFGHPMTAQL